jgi:RNA polymerase sigma-54 factor
MEMQQSLRLEQRQLLTPRMIQSMEILQMPLAALEERIEQELETNPVLEIREDHAEPGEVEVVDPDHGDNDTLRVGEGDGDLAADFARLERISEYLENEEFSPSYNELKRLSHGPSTASYAGERDAKLDAMANTAARGGNLTEHLLNQWALVDIATIPNPALNGHAAGESNGAIAQPAAFISAEEIRQAGETLIGYLDDRGYLPIAPEYVRADAIKRRKAAGPPAAFHEAFRLVRTLEPPGVGAVDLRDCMLLQLDALERDRDLSAGHDFALERALVKNHLKDLEQNRYPQIARKTGRSIEDLKEAVRRLGRLHPHPGKLIAPDESPAIMPDATIRYNEESGEYVIEMSRDQAPDLYIRQLYRKMLKQRQGDKKTREFISQNVRNARWLIESIEQRRTTIERVIRAVVDHQREFFEKGPESLKPLPMIQVADELGIHVATVSRAVSEKWVDTPRGIFPLRRFFSGGTTNDAGEEMSWDAVKEKLKRIIELEDKSSPLNDDQIVEKLAGEGIVLARRTVAKYRKLLGIPTARQRKEY